MDTFNSNSQGSWASNAKLTNVTKKQVRRKLLQRSSCASKPVPAKAERWDFHGKTIGIRPSTRNLCLFQSNRTHWVAYNQGSPFLADAPRDRKGWANTNKPQVRTQTQLSRVGSQGAGIHSAANTGKLKGFNSPYSVHFGTPIVNDTPKMHFLTQYFAFLDFFWAKPNFFIYGLFSSCKMIANELPKLKKIMQNG